VVVVAFCQNNLVFTVTKAWRGACQNPSFLFVKKKRKVVVVAKKNGNGKYEH
jgi:hypothetical protein